MKINSINLHNFRNYAEERFVFAPGVNVRLAFFGQLWYKNFCINARMGKIASHRLRREGLHRLKKTPDDALGSPRSGP